MSLSDCRECGFECNSPATYCLCLCPYCGKKNRNCRCSQNSKTKTKNFLREKTPSYNSEKKIRSPSTKNHIVERWWRLEKWQIGRSKFA